MTSSLVLSIRVTSMCPDAGEEVAVPIPSALLPNADKLALLVLQ